MSVNTRFAIVIGWTILCCAFSVTAEVARRYARSQGLAEGYAAALASCANGGDFLVGNRIVHCFTTDVK